MNQQQFQRMWNARRRYEPAPLFSGPVLDRLLRDAGRAEARRARAAEAWNRIVPPAAAGRCEVVGFEQGIVTVAVADAATRCYLEACRASLRESLARSLGPVRGLRFEKQPRA